VDAVLQSLAGLDGDVLFLLNWAAGAEPLGAVIGHERVLLGFGAAGGTMDGDVVRYRATGLMTRLVPMPIGEPDGRSTPRLERIVRTLRTAGSTPRPSRGWMPGSRRTPRSRCHSGRRCSRRVARSRWPTIRTRSAP
jgi:ketopantoate reductase